MHVRHFIFVSLLAASAALVRASAQQPVPTVALLDQYLA
jgi:hypothetical protein